MTQEPQISFEIEETIILKQGGKLIREFCPLCDMDADLVSPDIVALVTGVSEREIFRRIEAREVHFFERPQIYVCLNSLAAIEKNKTIKKIS